MNIMFSPDEYNIDSSNADIQNPQYVFNDYAEAIDGFTREYLTNLYL